MTTQNSYRSNARTFGRLEIRLDYRQQLQMASPQAPTVYMCKNVQVPCWLERSTIRAKMASAIKRIVVLKAF